MATTFYDEHGEPVAYSTDSIHLFSFSGRPLAYVSGDSIYSFSGRHLGRLHDGWIWDNDGNAVLFAEDANGGPTRPVKRVKPVKGVRQVKPVKSVRAVRPVSPIRRNQWASRGGLDFFG